LRRIARRTCGIHDLALDPDALGCYLVRGGLGSALGQSPGFSRLGRRATEVLKVMENADTAWPVGRIVGPHGGQASDERTAVDEGTE